MPDSSKPRFMMITALVVLTASLILAANATAADAPPPIAGVNPDARPVGAPVITAVAKKQKDWYEQALTGVDSPYPASLRFLEDQGNWYTPFTRPGMHGRYDIRNWHK